MGRGADLVSYAAGKSSQLALDISHKISNEHARAQATERGNFASRTRGRKILFAVTHFGKTDGDEVKRYSS